ncbi:MAG: ABC transporter permease [Candidatus Brocadiaceae bacterium]|nr:ABC transporter permease [Candidatus Brocadiaceae bacterium]
MNKCTVTIAGITAREVTRQTHFYFVVCGGVFLILSSFSFTLFAFGEETRMIKEMGISTITVCSLFLASLSASNTISKEMENSTIMTLLSKPVSKGTILIGKFFGVVFVVFVVFCLMGGILIFSLGIRHAADVHAGLFPSFLRVGADVFPLVVLSFLQIAVMCAIAIAGALYLPMVSNVCFCLFIYIFGSLIPLVRGLLEIDTGVSSLCLSLFFIFFPNLEMYNVLGGESGVGSSSVQLVLVCLYAIFYIILVLFLSRTIFEKKECY